MKVNVAGVPDESPVEREESRWLPGLWFKPLAGWWSGSLRTPGGKQALGGAGMKDLELGMLMYSNRLTQITLELRREGWAGYNWG